MRTLLKRLFVINWQRKSISLILSIIIWLLVYHSLMTEKTFSNVPVRVSGVSKGKIIGDLDTEGFLNKKISLTLYGHKKILDQINAEDIQVLLNAQNKDSDWVANIKKNQLIFLNKFINPYPSIRSVQHDPFVITVSSDVENQ